MASKIQIRKVCISEKLLTFRSSTAILTIRLSKTETSFLRIQVNLTIDGEILLQKYFHLKVLQIMERNLYNYVWYTHQRFSFHFYSSTSLDTKDSFFLNQASVIARITMLRACSKNDHNFTIYCSKSFLDINKRTVHTFSLIQ